MEEGFMWQEPILEVPLTRIQQINQILSRGGMNPGEVQEFVGKELHQQVFLAIKMKSMSLVEWYTLNCLDRMPRMRDKHLNTLLMAAIESGSPEIFELLKNVGIDIHHKNKNRHTALHLGVKKGLYDVVEWLIENHANVNDVGRVYQNLETTPLYLAAEHGHLQLVQMLLNAGASVRYCGPLWVAVRGGKLDIVRILVGGNMPIGNSAILLAVNRQNWEILDIFLEIEEVKSRVLSAAAKSERVEVFNTLLRRTDIIKTAGENTNALLIATKSGNERVVNMLLNSQEYNPSLVSREHPSCEIYVSQHEARNFADIEFEEIRRYEYNAIALAISKNYLEIARLLLIDGRVNPSAISLQICSKRGYTTLIPLLISDARIDVNARDFEDKTALQHAVESKNTDIVETLLDHGDINPNIGEPLWIALAFNERRIVELLLSHHKINLKTIEGRNSLIVGIENGNVDIVALVLGEQAVDPNSVDDDGKSAVGLAIRTNSNQKYRILGLLFDDERLNPNLAGNFDDTSPFHHVISISTAGAGRAMFNLFFEDSRTDINLMNDETPLHTAVSCEQIWIIEELLAHSEIQPNIKDRHGQSPLYRAVLGGKPEIVQALLHSREIDVNTVDEGSNRTALIEAVSQGNLEIISLLLEAEALDINYVIGNTFALRLAATKGDLDVVERLLSHKGIDPDIYLKSSDTNLLFEAVASANVPLIKKLVASNRLNPNYRHRATRETPLMHAMAIERRDIVKLLLNSERIDISIQRDGETAFEIASRNNQPNILRLLLKHNPEQIKGVSVEMKGKTLYEAVRLVDKVMYDILIAEGDLDLNMVSTYMTRSILMEAVLQESVDMVSGILSNQRLDINQVIRDETALGIASRAQDSTILDMLLGDSRLDISKYGTGNVYRIFFYSVERKMPQIVRQFLEKNLIDVNEIPVGMNETVLVRVIEMDRISCLRELLNMNNIQINEVRRGKLALASAIDTNLKLVRTLLAHSECDPNMTINRNDNSFLYKAIDARDKELVEIFIHNRRTDVNFESPNTNKTCLMAAIEKEEAQIFELLINCERIDINKRVGNEFALNTAFAKLNLKLIESLLLHPEIEPNLRVLGGTSTLLFQAAVNQRYEIFEILLNHRDIDPNAFDSRRDCFLLIYLIRERKVQYIRALLENKNLELNRVYKDDFPLYVAGKQCIEDGYFETIDLLLVDIRVEVNKLIDENSATLLYLAVQEKCIGLMERLIRLKNVNINYISPNTGRSILYEAILQRQEDFVALLLNSEDIQFNHYEALEFAERHGLDRLEDLLNEKMKQEKKRRRRKSGRKNRNIVLQMFGNTEETNPSYVIQTGIGTRTRLLKNGTNGILRCFYGDSKLKMKF